MRLLMPREELRDEIADALSDRNDLDVSWDQMAEAAIEVLEKYGISFTEEPCAVCGGEGRIFKSRYGGNDPDVWDAGPCPACNKDSQP